MIDTKPGQGLAAFIFVKHGACHVQVESLARKSWMRIQLGGCPSKVIIQGYVSTYDFVDNQAVNKRMAQGPGIGCPLVVNGIGGILRVSLEPHVLTI